MADTPYPLPRETRESGINVGNGTAGPYGPSAYKIFDTADVTVWRKEPADKFFRDVTSTSIVTKTSGAELDTFSVTFASAVPTTTKWYHSAKRVSNRQVAVTRAGALDAPQLEKELSKQASAQSEIRRDLGRAVRVDPDNVAPIVSPAPDGYYSKWEGGNLVPGGTVQDIESAQENAAQTRTDRLLVEAARDLTLAALASVVSAKATRALAIADNPGLAPDPDYYDVKYYDSSYRTGSGGLYRKVASDPGTPDAFRNRGGLGSWYRLDEKIRNAKMFGGNLPSLIASLRDGDTVDGADGTYATSGAMVCSANNVTFIGKATINFTNLSTTGSVFNFVDRDGIRFAPGSQWRFNGPETRASWDAKTTGQRATLYSAVYAQGCTNTSFEGIRGGGVQIVLRGHQCPAIQVKDFEANGFLPDVPAMSTGGGAPIAPYIDGLNWCDALYFTECHDARFRDISGDHYGNLLVGGGNAQRNIIDGGHSRHMWDNNVYFSSTDGTEARNIHCDYSGGSVVKLLGSHNRARNVTGDNVVAGVTLCPYNDGSGVNLFRQMGSDGLGEGISVSNAYFVALAIPLLVSGTEVALSDVTFRKLKGVNMLGTNGNTIPIRLTVAMKGALVEDWTVEGCAETDVVQIAAPAGATAEAYVPKNVIVRAGRAKGCKSTVILSYVKNFRIEDVIGIDSALAANQPNIRGSNVWDGVIRNNGSNDTSHRIDFRGCNRVSIRDNGQYAYDSVGLEVFGNTTDELKNITTLAPWKVGQWCLTTTGAVAVSKGVGNVSQWVTV